MRRVFLHAITRMASVAAKAEGSSGGKRRGDRWRTWRENGEGKSAGRVRRRGQRHGGAQSICPGGNGGSLSSVEIKRLCVALHVSGATAIAAWRPGAAAAAPRGLAIGLVARIARSVWRRQASAQASATARRQRVSNGGGMAAASARQAWRRCKMARGCAYRLAAKSARRLPFGEIALPLALSLHRRWRHRVSAQRQAGGAQQCAMRRTAATPAIRRRLEAAWRRVACSLEKLSSARLHPATSHNARAAASATARRRYGIATCGVALAAMAAREGAWKQRREWRAALACGGRRRLKYLAEGGASGGGVAKHMAAAYQ